MYHLLLTLAAASMMGLSCSNGNGAGISGKLTNTNGETVYLDELLPSTMVTLDSVKVDDEGHFRFVNRAREHGFYLVRAGSDNNNIVTLLTDSTETVHITGSVGSLSTDYTVDGSAGSALIMEITDYSILKNKQVDSLGAIWQQAQGTPQFEAVRVQVDAGFAKLQQEAKDHIAGFIHRNSSSLATIIALYQRMGRAMVFDQNNEDDLQYFQAVADNLSKSHPQSKHVQGLLMRVDNMKRTFVQQQAQRERESKLASGNEAPDIRMNNPSGKPIALSSLRGKVVLIDFWASWCKPCRIENPGVVKLYNKYRNKGFEIYAVSLDRTKEAWMKAIQDDNLTWLHVSDLAFWSSPILQVYGISAIPSTVLVDKEGRIIARNLRGQDLERKLEEILG